MSKESERQTRGGRIDPELSWAGWKVVAFDPKKPLSAYNKCAVKEFPTENGPADYALCSAGKVLGVVEAKKVSLGPQNVLTQAERYSKGATTNPLNFRGYRVPFLYSTNGEVIWHHDVRYPLSRSRRISHFHTPGALTERLQQDFDKACQRLKSLPNNHQLIRPYQVEANTAVEQAISDQKRHMLLAMATGTGKTFTMVNQIYRLMKSGAAKRILFMVDRRALAAQAVRAFASFEAEPGLKFDKIYEVYSQRFHREDFDEDEKFDPKVLPASYLLDPRSGHAFVYVCTIQRMTMNLFGREAAFEISDESMDEDDDRLDIPVHAFDLIVADECHRGYTGKQLAVWRDTLDHFDAIKIGLTATPASHTTTYFRDVVYRYEYERAVREGFLVDYDAVTIKSDVRLNGVFLREGEQVGVIDPESGAEQLDLLEAERQFPSEEVEIKVTSPDSNRKILEEIKKYALEHQEQYKRFPKTLIFAANDLQHTSHADQLVEIARDVFGQGDSFVQKITGSPTVDRPLQRIREFRNRKVPAIAVTVDLLSTGVDIPDLEFIVLLRAVKSRILFEQMLGRGTRKGEHYPDKTHFVVFDCFDGTLLEYFRKATAITAEPPRPEPRSITDIIEDIWSNRDRDYNIRCLVKRLQRIDRDMAGDYREQFAAFIPDGDVGKFASQIPQIQRKDFVKTMALLRSEKFQELLIKYRRKPRTFLVAFDTEDKVTSSTAISDARGNKWKPEDYLAAFARFIHENSTEIEAIRILLSRPKGWSTDALRELRQKLMLAPEQFTEKNLQRAHEMSYRKALVDIISMVKHAARDDEPLFTAQQRVNRAIMKVTGSHGFSAEQMQWLERIRQHLIENLSVDRSDFDAVPIFSRYGGWARANRAFEGELPDLLKQFNEAIAA
ncbi:MAG: DEAD/DEAH box helicase family protein [Deltaproteobacteria bacterium]|nr:DEAD/DEAH box helicase family protein [Deltaproteobacteria bacterium]